MPDEDNISLEPFWQDKASDEDGTKRNIRITNPNNPIEGYFLADQQASVDNRSYTGYLTKDGLWYIQRATQDGTVVTYEYFKDSKDYDFDKRVGLKYDSFDKIF